MMEKANPKEIEFIQEYNKICNSISDKGKHPPLTTPFKAQQSSISFIEFNNGIYTYGAYERGRREEIYSSSDMMEVMYYPIEFAVKEIAQDYESGHRMPGIDPRQQWFPLAVAYMRQIDNRWSERLYQNLSRFLSF